MLHAARWAFVTNHAVVLLQVSRHPDLTVREIAERVGITERAVHRILTDLTLAGYLIRSRVGRRSHYAVRAMGPLRHPMLGDIEVSRLLDALEPAGAK